MKLFLAYLHSAVSGLLIGVAIWHLLGPLLGLPVVVGMGVWGVWSAIVLVNCDKQRS